MKTTVVKDHQVCEWQQQWHYDHVATWCQGDLLLWDANAMKIIWLPWRGRLILHLRRTKSHYKPFLFNFPLEIDVLEHFRRYTMHTTWWSLSCWWPQLKGELRSNSAPSIDIEKALQGRSFCDLVSPLGTVRPCLKSGREHRTSVEVKHLLPFRKCCFAFSGNFCPLGAISCLVPRPGSCFSIQGKLLDRSYSSQKHFQISEFIPKLF